jgi:hypothetical protein
VWSRQTHDKSARPPRACLLGQAASTITGSPVFKKLLEVVLTFGNFLNQGSFRGNAQGVKINFLGELKSTKVRAVLSRRA